MLFTALVPAPPTPTTVIRGLSSCVTGMLRLIVITFLTPPPLWLLPKSPFLRALTVFGSRSKFV